MDPEEKQGTITKWLILSLLLGLHFARYLPFILHAQIVNGFEDGFIFLSQAWNYGITSLIFPYQKYFHTIQRIVAFSGTILPIDLIPYSFSASAFFLHFLPVTLLMSPRTNEITGSNILPKTLFSVLYLLLPVSNEVYGSLTNIHWYLQIWFLLVFFSSPSKNKKVRILEYSMMILYSATGISVLLFIVIWSTNLVFFKPLDSKRKLVLLCLPGCLLQLYGLLFLPNDIDIVIPVNNPVSLGGIICRLFWTNITGLFPMKFFAGTFSNLFFALTGALALLGTLYHAWKSGNEFWRWSFVLAIFIFGAGMTRTQTIVLDGLSGTRFSFLFTWTLLSYCLVLTFNTHSKWIRNVSIALIMIVFSVAIPCDFSINSDKKEYWHREILQNYYPLKVGETATLKNASCGLIRKPSEVQTLTSWQKLLLKNEVLWQKNETLVPVPDKTGFKVEKNELKTSIFSDIGPLEITFQHLDIKANDTVFLILDNKSGKFAFPAIPIMNQKGHDFIVFVNKRTLPRFEEYLLYVVNVNKKTVYLLPDTCKTSY